MTTQPLTPQNTHIIILAANATLVAEMLKQYGIPTDSGNIEPTLTVTQIHSMVDLTAFLGTAPSPTLPWCVLSRGNLPAQLQLAHDSMVNYFDDAQTLASCLSMRNNEYAIQPKLLRS